MRIRPVGVGHRFGAPVALVTGASSGIGAEIARLLAARGHDLVLVARNRQRLENVAAALNARYGIRSEVLVADLLDTADVARVAARICEGPVETVVNNAGVGNVGRFVELPLGDQLEQATLNVLALVALSHAALRAMASRRHGNLLNVSSVAGFVPSPRTATYAATKAFVTSFSESLHEEMLPFGVHVSALCPGFTRTKVHQRAGVRTSAVPWFMWSDVRSVAAAGLAALDRNQAVCIPGVANKVAAAASQITSRDIVRRVSGTVTSRMFGVGPNSAGADHRARLVIADSAPHVVRTPVSYPSDR